MSDSDVGSEPIPLASFYDLALVSDLALSPDGKRVAYVTDEFDSERDERRRSVRVTPTDGSRPPHRLTRASDAHSPKWSPDGSRLAVLAAREQDVALAVNEVEDDAREDAEHDETGTEGETGTEREDGETDDPKPQVWVFDLDLGGDARQVTTREEGVREFDWGPNGERIVVATRDPTEEEREYLKGQREENAPIETERLQHKFDGTGWLDTVETYLFVVSVETREERRLDDAYGGGAFEAMVGLQPTWVSGTEIAFLSNRAERPDDSAAMDLYLADVESGDVTQVTDGELTVSLIEPAPAESEARLAFAAGDPDEPTVPTQVYAWDGECYESLTEELDRTLTRNTSLRWVDGETILSTIADEAHTRLCRVGTNGETQFVGSDVVEDASILTFDSRNGVVAFVRSHPVEGMDVHTAAIAAFGDGIGENSNEYTDLRRVTACNDEFIERQPMAPCRRITYESAGHTIDALCYTPPGFDPDEIRTDGNEPYPLIVSIHGGPISYDTPEWSFEYAALASRGYLVVRINYRGGSSYGRAFAEELYGQWGTVEVTDIVAGIEALVERGWVDSDSVFGHGFSYGGITQGFLVTQTDVLTAAAPEHGIYDLRSAFGTDDSHLWMASEFGLPWENRETFHTHSSITDAGEIDTPLLVMAGGEDWRCPPSQSEQLYVSAKKQGVPAKLVLYPDEHHDVGDPDRAIHRLEQLTAWYKRHDPARTDETSEAKPKE